jgi:CubicO group peptidase (beta-lactamase class C family)
VTLLEPTAAIKSSATSTPLPSPTPNPTSTPLPADTPVPTPVGRCLFLPIWDQQIAFDYNADDDFWEFETVEEAGIDEGLITAGLRELRREPSVYSFLVIHNDRIVIEEYLNRSWAYHSHNVHSVSKSILSTLVGIAIQEGYLQGVDQPVAELLPANFVSIENQPKRSITLNHMLTMTAGFEWANDTDNMPSIEGQEDWVQALIDVPLETDPGLDFNYNTGISHIMSAVIAQASGMNTCQFAYQYLFDPLDITVEYWGRDPQGIFTGGWDLYITPREMAKFGLLYLNGGSWKGEQVVPPAWVEASLSGQVDVGAQFDYGYWWWLSVIWGYPVYSAIGFGGQRIHIVPDLDIVVVTTSNDRYFGTGDEFDSFAFLERYLIPAAAAERIN